MSFRAGIVAAGFLALGSTAARAQGAEPVDDRFVNVTRHVPAVYPQIARSARFEGLAIVAVSFDERGAVTSAIALSGMPLLVQAAVANVKQWTFAPSPQGRAVVVYEFRISPTCVDDAAPPPFETRRPNLATVFACSLTVQAYSREPIR